MSHVLPWVESVNAAEWVIEGPTTDHDPRPSPVKAGFANAAGMEVVTYHLQDLIYNWSQKSNHCFISSNFIPTNYIHTPSIHP